MPGRSKCQFRLSVKRSRYLQPNHLSKRFNLLLWSSHRSPRLNRLLRKPSNQPEKWTMIRRPAIPIPTVPLATPRQGASPAVAASTLRSRTQETRSSDRSNATARPRADAARSEKSGYNSSRTRHWNWRAPTRCSRFGQLTQARLLTALPIAEGHCSAEKRGDVVEDRIARTQRLPSYVAANEGSGNR